MQAYVGAYKADLWLCGSQVYFADHFSDLSHTEEHDSIGARGRWVDRVGPFWTHRICAPSDGGGGR